MHSISSDLKLSKIGLIPTNAKCSLLSFTFLSSDIVAVFKSAFFKFAPVKIITSRYCDWRRECHTHWNKCQWMFDFQRHFCFGQKCLWVLVRVNLWMGDFLFLQNGKHELYAKYRYFSKLKVLQNYKYYWNINSEYIKLLNETNLYNTFLYLKKNFNESHIFYYFFIIYRCSWVLIWVSVYIQVLFCLRNMFKSAHGRFFGRSFVSMNAICECQENYFEINWCYNYDSVLSEKEGL